MIVSPFADLNGLPFYEEPALYIQLGGQIRGWEFGGWKNTNTSTAPYTRVGVAFHGWEGGPGAYNCGALSRLFGPDNERWAVHGEFSIGSGWALQ